MQEAYATPSTPSPNRKVVDYEIEATEDMPTSQVCVDMPTNKVCADIPSEVSTDKTL